MTTGGDELFVTIGGKDVGLQAILQRVDAEMAKNADQAVRLGQQYARLAQAQGAPAAASQILAGTMQQAGGASERALLSIQTQAARTNTGLAVLPRTLAGLSHEAASMATGMLGLGTALTIAKAGVDSFADAFKFKADLDATTASINAQLKGVRESSQVYAQAAKFAAQYKLTQQETTEALQASIGVMRNSKASVEDILGVLARLQVLSPEQSLQEAAVAVKALASGDTTSLVTRFEVGRDVANQMKKEIQGGADAVQVMSKFLGETGIGMDVLAAKTTGVAGGFKELAQAQEQLKIAQAEFAQGPGLLILQGQIAATSGATRLLSGDFAAMGQSLANNAVAFGASSAGAQAYFNALQSGQGVLAAQNAANIAATQTTQMLTQAHTDGGGGAFVFADAEQAAAAAALQAAAAAQQDTLEQNRLAGAHLLGAGAADAAGAALRTAASALADDISKKQESEAQTQRLSAAQTTLASLGPAVAGGLQSAASAAAFLATRYGFAYSEALKLISAQAALAGAKAADPLKGVVEDRLTRDTTADRAQVKSNQALEANRVLLAKIAKAKADADKPPKGGGGGGVKLSDQTKLQNSLLASQEAYSDKSADIAAQHAVDVEKITQDFYTKMRAADRDFNQSQLEGRAGFYDRLGGIESNSIRQAASQQYEAASIEAGKIAQEKGADVAEKYMSAQEQIISARAKRLNDIEKAEKDKDTGKAEYLKGVDKEYQRAEDAKLARVKEGEGSLAAEKQKQLDDASAKEADALDKIGLAADRAAERKVTASDRAGKAIDAEQLKVDGLATSYDRLGAAGQRAGITPTAAPPPATTASTTPGTATGAVPGDTSGILAALDGIRAAVDAAAARIVGAEQSTTSAVSRLGGKFAG